MRRVTAALLLAAAIGQVGVAAPSALAAPRASTDIRAARRATAESIAAQYAAEQFRANRIGDEASRKLLAENEAQRRRLAAVLKDAKATAAERDAARAQLAALDAQLAEVNAKLLASEQTGDELRAQLREYQRQISDAVESASPEVAAAYELYAAGDRDTAYEIIDRLSQVEAAAAKRAGEIRAGALMRRPATLAYDRRERGEMTLAQVVVAWERAQAADPTYHEGWVNLTNLLIEAGRLPDARKAAELGLATADNDTQRGHANGLLGEVMLAAGDPRGALAAWDTGLKQLKAAYAADPNDRGAARGIMAVLDRKGDMLTADVDFAAAAAVYGEELAMGRRIAAAAPDSIRAQRDLMICLSKMGDAYLNNDNPAAAKAMFEEMVALTRKVLATDPTHTGFQREYAIAVMKLGEFHTQTKRPDLAKPLIAEGVAIVRRLVTVDATALARRDLSMALEHQSRTIDTRTPAGLKAYRVLMDEALQIRRELAAADPTNVQIQREVAVGLDAYADVHLERGDLATARRGYEEALGIYRRIAAAPTSNGHDQRRVGLVVGALAAVVHKSGDVAGAQPLWEEMLSIRRRLVQENPGAAILGQDLGGGLLTVGRIHSAASNWQAALPFYREAIVVQERAYALDRNDLKIKLNLALAYKYTGDTAYELRQFDDVKPVYQLAISHFYELLQAQPDDAEAHRDFWGTLFMWAQMVDDPVAWSETVKYMEAADAKGFLTANDKTYLVDARRHAKRTAVAAAASPGAHP